MKIRMSDRPRERVRLYAGYITVAEALSTDALGRLFLAILLDANGMDPDEACMKADEYIAFLAYKQQASMEVPS